jgi:holo-[acyl-carrier protein] synthase
MARIPMPSGHVIGASIVDVTALDLKLTAADAGQFLAATFTSSELAYCGRRMERLAARLAAKNAVATVIGADSDALPPRMIEVARRPTGQPYMRAVGRYPWPGDSRDWSWSVSLAHEAGLAIAVVIARPWRVADLGCPPDVPHYVMLFHRTQCSERGGGTHSGWMSISRISPNSGRIRIRSTYLRDCRVLASISWFGSEVFST